MSSNEEIIFEFEELISEGRFIINHPYQGYIPIAIHDSFLVKIITFFKEVIKLRKDDVNIKQIKECIGRNELYNFKKAFEILKNVKDYYIKGYLEIDTYKTDINQDEILEKIFLNFHKMAIKLRDRHEGRNTLDIEDEYDVQDLLYAILNLFFDDVRKEEYVPSYAGKASRMDFLLKNEEIVIETKKTRNNLKDKEIGEQLIIDIARYRIHPNCKKLICFVYDPEGRIANPIGITNDLENNDKDFLKLYIYPR